MGQVPTSTDTRRGVPALGWAELERLQSRAAEAAALLKTLSNEKQLLIFCTLGSGELDPSLSSLSFLAKFGLSTQPKPERSPRGR